MHQLVTFVAKYFLVISVAITFYVWLRLSGNQKKSYIIEAAIGAVIALALAALGSKLFYNPRPFMVGHFTPYFSHANGNGFPSDHMLLASFLAFLCFKYSKLAGWILLALAVMIGGARVIAGVHHNIDILGSAVFAAAGVAIAQLVTKKTSRSN